MARQLDFRNMKFNPLFIVVGVLILIAIYNTNMRSSDRIAPIVINWNSQVLDVTKNSNALRTLLLLETNTAPTPTSPSPSSVLHNPADFYGQYLQFSGTIKSVRSYSPQNNLENITIGNSAEMIMLTNDGTTIIDCFLIGSNTNLNSGVSVTVLGYSPGIRYGQNTQGGVTSYLALIGHLGSLASTTSDVSQNPTFPIYPGSNSQISPNP